MYNDFKAISTVLSYMLANEPDVLASDLSESLEALVKAGAGPFMARFLLATTLAGLGSQVQEASGIPDNFKAVFATELAKVQGSLLPAPKSEG